MSDVCLLKSDTGGTRRTSGSCGDPEYAPGGSTWLTGMRRCRAVSVNKAAAESTQVA